MTTNVTNALAVVSTLPQEKVDPQPKWCRGSAEEAYQGGIVDQEAELAGDVGDCSSCPKVCDDVPSVSCACEHEHSDEESSSSEPEVLCPMRAYVVQNELDNEDSSESEFDGYHDCLANEFDREVPQYLYPFFQRQQPSKKQRTGKYTGEVVVEILDRDGNLVPIRALLDTGTSSSILLRDYVRKGRASSYKGKPIKWQTMGGNFVTKRRCLVDFKFPELSTQKKVTWIMHVNEKTDSTHSLYDMIIGMDLMTELGI